MMNDARPQILVQPVRHQIKVKRSVFIGSADSASDPQDAIDYINRVRQEFHDATHNCYAYRIDADTFRYSDDGEPSGTAGKPILAMLDKYHLMRVVMVITRYFGGVKLGTGGLIRAYSQAAEEVIQNGRLRDYVAWGKMKITYPYALTRQVQYWVNQFGGSVDSSSFDTEVTAQVRIPLANCEPFRQQLIAGGGNQITVSTPEGQ